MSSFKVTIAMLASISMLLFSAIAATSASAGSWFVNGTKLAKGATVALATTAKVDESISLNVPNIGIRLTCSGSSLKGTKPFIQGEASAGAESLIFTGCSEITPSTCKIQTELATEPVVASVETGTSPLDRIRLTPKAGKTLAIVDFEGTCAVAGEKPLNGQVVLDSKTGQTESVTLPVEALGTIENNSLELASNKACFENGKSLLQLSSGQKWGFH